MKLSPILNSNKDYSPRNASSYHAPSIAEKGLYLINDPQEWQKLKASMRASGIVTNGAAKLMIIEYLHQRPDMNSEMMSQYSDRKNTTQKRRLSYELLGACGKIVGATIRNR